MSLEAVIKSPKAIAQPEHDSSVPENRDGKDQITDDQVTYFSDEDAAVELQEKQRHRLLNLRHAIKCPYGKNCCPVSPHCWRLKSLWRHLLACKEQYCRVPLCVSSRFLLNHYGKCPKESCAICLPVRETYKRAHTEDDEREFLKQNSRKRIRVSRSLSSESSRVEKKRNILKDDKEDSLGPLLGTIKESCEIDKSSPNLCSVSSPTLQETKCKNPEK